MRITEALRKRGYEIECILAPVEIAPKRQVMILGGWRGSGFTLAKIIAQNIEVITIPPFHPQPNINSIDSTTKGDAKSTFKIGKAEEKRMRKAQKRMKEKQ